MNIDIKIYPRLQCGGRKKILPDFLEETLTFAKCKIDDRTVIIPEISNWLNPTFAKADMVAWNSWASSILSTEIQLSEESRKNGGGGGETIGCKKYPFIYIYIYIVLK